MFFSGHQRAGVCRVAGEFTPVVFCSHVEAVDLSWPPGFCGKDSQSCSGFSGKWKRRSPFKVKERTHEEATEALHAVKAISAGKRTAM
jgi:hypothetical protein